MYSSGDLWRRELAVGQVPDERDMCYLWPDEDGETTGGPYLRAARRFLDSAGQWHVELSKVLQDPQSEDLQILSREDLAGLGHHFDVWWTSQGTMDEAKLTAAGWVKQ